MEVRDQCQRTEELEILATAGGVGWVRERGKGMISEIEVRNTGRLNQSMCSYMRSRCMQREQGSLGFQAKELSILANIYKTKTLYFFFFFEFMLSQKGLQAADSWEWIGGGARVHIHILQKRKFSANLLACIQVYHVS